MQCTKKFEVPIENGQYHGKGRTVCADPDSCSVHINKSPVHLEGEWIRGVFAFGRCYCPDGTIFEGKWNDKRHLIEGIHVDSKGDVVYDGQWSGTLYHGKGRRFWVGEKAVVGDRITYSGKRIMYDGEFVSGQPEGQGVMYHADGRVKNDGKWIRGNPLHPGCIVEQDPQDDEKACVYRTYIMKDKDKLVAEGKYEKLAEVPTVDIRCSICFEFYDDVCRTVAQLDCGHMFCSQCTSQLKACPMDRQVCLNRPQVKSVDFVVASYREKNNA